MIIKNLGAVDAPMLLCGGAYSNLEALFAMFDEAGRRDITASHIVHTGDVVAYCADAVETAYVLSESCAHSIRGNVEIQLAEDADDCGCGFAEGSACSVMSGAWYAHARAAFSREPALRHWMARLPDRLTFTMNGVRCHVLHGAASAINRHMFASMPDGDFEDEIALADGADLVIGGHSGLPFTRNVGHAGWHNTGALGIPANDGTARVWVSILSPEGDGVRVEHVPLEYDHRAAAAKMRHAGLPEGYASALGSGLWPSRDTLPDHELAQTGLPISARSHLVAPRPRPQRSVERVASL